MMRRSESRDAMVNMTLGFIGRSGVKWFTSMRKQYGDEYDKERRRDAPTERATPTGTRTGIRVRLLLRQWCNREPLLSAVTTPTPGGCVGSTRSRNSYDIPHSCRPDGHMRAAHAE
jgi:hypothetical protein